MSVNNIFSFSFLLLFPLSSFGVTINRQNIPANNRAGMKRVYKAIEPLIAIGHYKRARNALVKAYEEYSQDPANIQRDLLAQWSWPYLDDAIRYYERYDNTNRNSQQSRNFKITVLEDIRSATAAR
ncbi:MAG: hypothetical protein LBJ13_02225 [Puniceicoccales bacterium]|jgi:hypothetical protein|nr:hypothetical protein [Puniceicoccales bacterium]